MANAFGSSVAARTLTMKQALLIATVCEFSGSVLLGEQVGGQLIALTHAAGPHVPSWGWVVIQGPPSGMSCRAAMRPVAGPPFSPALVRCRPVTHPSLGAARIPEGIQCKRVCRYELNPQCALTLTAPGPCVKPCRRLIPHGR